MKALAAAAILVLALGTTWAKDGPTIYKSKCAGCHGAQGEGKMGPKLAATSLSEDDIVKILTTGGLSKAPHTNGFKGAKSDNAKKVATYVKSLQ